MPSTGTQILSNSIQVTEDRLIQGGRDPGRSPVLPCPSYSSSACIHTYSLIPPACFPVCLNLCTGTQGDPVRQGLSPISLSAQIKVVITVPSHTKFKALASILASHSAGMLLPHQLKRSCLLLALLIPQRRSAGIAPKEKLIFIFSFCCFAEKESDLVKLFLTLQQNCWEQPQSNCIWIILWAPA